MANFDLKKLQGIELEILNEFVRLCEKHNLTYSLVYGTAIGAVRHQGFIPWDDDIDVAMPRKDYEYFWRVVAKEMNENFFFQNYHTDKKCGLIFGKIRKNNTVLSENYSYMVDMHQGVWIDIFPYDNVSDNERVRKFEFSLGNFLKNLYIIKCGFLIPEDKTGILFKITYRIAKIISIFVSKKYLIQTLDELMQKHNNKPCENVFIRGDISLKYIHPKKTVEEFVDILFEGNVMKIFKDHEHHLGVMYGDYMQLPPIEQRENGSSHFIHEFKEKA